MRMCMYVYVHAACVVCGFRSPALSCSRGRDLPRAIMY